MAMLSNLTLAIPGAGRRTLLSVLPEGLCLPDSFRLCVLDAERPDCPEQLALLDGLAAQPGLRVIFALNKADRITGPRTAVTRMLALLRERGFRAPELYPVCAAAARLFRLPATEARPEELQAQNDLYYRFGPGEQSLSAFAVLPAPAIVLGSREISPEQRRLAMINTGVPALAEGIRARSVAASTAPVAAPAPIETTPELEAPAPVETTPEPEAPAPIETTPEPEAPAPAEAPSPAEELLSRAEKADCAELLELARAVGASEAPEEERRRTLEQLHALYLRRQTAELETMTRGAASLELPALRALADRIAAGPYTGEARAAALEELNPRLDALQTEALEQLCAGVETADARSLARLREELEQADCAEHLKAPCFRRVEARQDELDLEALERVTAGAEHMTEKELHALAVTLEAENWSPRYVTAYRHRIALLREAALFREARQQLADLNEMERQELLELRERTQARGLPDRFTLPALAEIDRRLYNMDMLRLLALENDFDALDFEDIDALRLRVAGGDYCQQAKETYLARLLSRERALILQRTEGRAQLVRQLIGQCKLRMVDFELASASQDYEEQLAAFWGGSGLEQPRDIPVFLLDNASRYAFTGTRFYYKTGRELAFVPLGEIERFQTMKQHMSLILQVVRKDNSYLLTGARLGRSGAERTLEFLNGCLRRWEEPGIGDDTNAAPIRTPSFVPADYAAPVTPCLPDAGSALESFRARCAAEGLREGNLIREGEDGWEQRSRRLLANFGLPEQTPLIWYCSTGLLGALREGVALGPRGLYQKQAKLPTRIFPLSEIYSLTPSGRQAMLTTVRGESFPLELPAVMAEPVAEYIRAIQLGDLLREQH